MADSARAETPSLCGGVESAEDAMYPERSSILLLMTFYDLDDLV